MVSNRPQTSFDVEVLLSEVVGSAKKITSYVDIYKEKGKQVALVKPKGAVPYILWRLINKKVKELGGKWWRKERLWTVPLNG